MIPVLLTIKNFSEMLRSSSRHVRVFTNRQRNLLPLSGGFSISWQRLCSPSSDSASESPAGDNQNDIDRLLSQNKSRVAQATQVMAQIADLKRSKTISETDYKNDSRFGNMMKLLESNIVQKAEPLIIIQGLKVEIVYNESCKLFIHILAGPSRVRY